MRHDATAHSIAQMVASAHGTRIRFGSGSNAEIEALRGMVIALSARCGDLEDLIEQHAVNNPPPTILERIQQVN